MLEQQLIQAGVRNLKEFGYPGVNESNILTDRIYSGFFRSMLEENRGRGVDIQIDALLQKMALATGGDHV